MSKGLGGWRVQPNANFHLKMKLFIISSNMKVSLITHSFIPLWAISVSCVCSNVIRYVI